MMIVLRSDQVADNQVGISFCNVLLLKPKLRVSGDKYLALIVPGRIGTDLQNLLNSENPALRARCHETTLTLKDPVLGKQFPRAVVIVNLGKESVSPTALPISLQTPADSTKVLWLQAWQSKCPDIWTQTVTSNLRETRMNVVQILAKITKLNHRNFDVWNFQLNDDRLFFVLGSQLEKLML
jgi:hypothetical protein